MMIILNSKLFIYKLIKNIFDLQMKAKSGFILEIHDTNRSQPKCLMTQTVLQSPVFFTGQGRSAESLQH